jgi:hypothetical protein
MDANGHEHDVHWRPMLIEQGFTSATSFGRWPAQVKRLINQVQAAGRQPEAILCFSLDLV